MIKCTSGHQHISCMEGAATTQSLQQSGKQQHALLEEAWFRAKFQKYDQWMRKKLRAMEEDETANMVGTGYDSPGQPEGERHRYVDATEEQSSENGRGNRTVLGRTIHSPEGGGKYHSNICGEKED
mmetsp:Transcript_35015/g.78813  ORF Transcript_35015/g.78813 Transcript_35015/m.78813 type:complete len:126 (+) Transcript_35015:896-1273(+)